MGVVAQVTADQLKGSATATLHQGRQLAQLIGGSWRKAIAPIDCCPATLDRLSRSLEASGCAGLVWRRLRHVDSLNEGATAAMLRDRWRLNVVKLGQHRRGIAEIVRRFALADIQTILIKGIAVATNYPDDRLRPVGDIDLRVAREQFAAAIDVIARMRDEQWSLPIDLHQDESEIDGIHFGAAFSRSRELAVGDTSVRILGPEDSLRMVCLHSLRHGAWRPLWLCDIAAGIENRPAEFDWNIVFGDEPIGAHWVQCMMLLANRLLGADLSGVPTGSFALPNWMERRVLEVWGDLGDLWRVRYPLPVSMRHGVRGVARAIVQRWNDSIRATVEAGGRFDDSPRLPLKIKWGLKTLQRVAFESSK